MSEKTSNIGIALAIAAAGLFQNAQAQDIGAAAKDAQIKCFGINECSGHNACKIAGVNACKGQSSCKGMGFVDVDSEKDCTDKGGKVEKLGE